MSEITELARGCARKDYSRAPQKDFTCDGKTVKVFKVEGEESTLFYWNSSNFQSINHDTALRNLTEALLSGEDGGTVMDGWNEIMFEIN